MPTELVPPNQNVRLTFGGTRRGYARIIVEASGPITVFVTTPIGAREFMRGRPVTPLFAHVEGVTEFDDTIYFPPSTEWTLMFVNREQGDDWDDARAIHYQINQK
jgi:hypothetical protein